MDTEEKNTDMEREELNYKQAYLNLFKGVDIMITQMIKLVHNAIRLQRQTEDICIDENPKLNYIINTDEILRIITEKVEDNLKKEIENNEN